ncbi:hypothetical protein AALP_AA2G169700 [Arabis alpina]|uniref:Uncharacterized protein n=1 Tax=Arabis alpina TaxID=50452 RepID=A0A087HI16_ARAAL|nr:hypothetical protein AALP_AA2G169700 [Arabis alpina]
MKPRSSLHVDSSLFKEIDLWSVGKPVLGDSSVEAGINGSFMPNGNDFKVSGSRSLSFVSGVNRMMAISIQQEVFNSATLVYFNEKRMRMVIRESKNGSISINVQDFGKVLSVARISSVLNVAGSAKIAKNNLTGSFILTDFNATVKSSNIGELLRKYIQSWCMNRNICVFFLRMREERKKKVEDASDALSWVARTI